jgi:hypothetical protein
MEHAMDRQEAGPPFSFEFRTRGLGGARWLDEPGEDRLALSSDQLSETLVREAMFIQRQRNGRCTAVGRASDLIPWFRSRGRPHPDHYEVLRPSLIRS